MAVIVETLMDRDFELGVDATSKTHPSSGTLNGYQVNLGIFSTKGVSGGAVTATWDPGSVANGAKVSTTVTVTGAALGDFVLVSFSLDLQEMDLSGSVSATDTVEVVLGNLTGAALDLGSGTLKASVFKVR